MGNTSSLEKVEPDPWWNQPQPQQTNQNESQQTSCAESEIIFSGSSIPETSRAQEDARPLHEMWYQREQTLGQTIQHLAEENMRLSSARRDAEKRFQEFEAETQHTSEELEKLRSEAEKAQQVFEKLHAQIQGGREDRQMITSELERIRSAFDAEREAKEQLMSEMQELKEQRDEHKRTVDLYNEQLKQKTLLVEKTKASLSQERKEKESFMNELEKCKEELIAAKASLASAIDSLKAQELSDQQKPQVKENNTSEESSTTRIRSPEAVAEMVKFQAEMSMRREARQRAMQAVSSEMERLRTELNVEREARKQATQQLEQALLQAGKAGKTRQEEALVLELEHAQQKMLSDKRKLKEISQENSRLQFELDNGREILAERTDELEKLQTQLNSEREQMQQQINALKDVTTICKEMLNIREGQVLNLKDKLRDIEASVTNKVQEKLPADLKAEYRTQIENIRSLKNLYEERMKLLLSEKEKLVQDAEEKSQRLDAEMKKSAEFEQQLADMKLALEEKEEENSNLQIQLDDSQDKSHGLAKELTLINNLFTQMLIGSSATEMDLDRLTRLLQENHDLITDITVKEDSSEIAAVLPKLILDLVNQADSGRASTSSTPTEERNEDGQINETDLEGQNDSTGETTITPESSGSQNKNSPVNGMAVHEIALNLPKVWKVLIELLSHHIAPHSLEDQEEKMNSCYKSIDTPSGPRLVISVSQTFLRLKDLILEKKSLQKELSRLKQLNGHLERKLNGQEQKLSVVSSELRKTWNVVDQMQTQHQKLHTHEKILRYELHEKRKMLNELKQELEYCREKWERARQKNSESEVEWKKLRTEFALRKKQPNDLLNNSGESGFLDERGDDSCEDDDTTTKDTGQLDPGIEELSGSEEICTSSPLQTNFPQPNPLINSTRMHTSSPIHNDVEVLNQPESDLVLGLDSNSLTNTDCSELQNNVHQNTYSAATEFNPSDLCLNSFGPLQQSTEQTHLSDCSINSPHTNCSTISIITLLKQQLAFFSRNLDYMSTSANDISYQNLEALESIFSLPPIQIPKSLNNRVTVQNCFQNYYLDNYEDIHNFNAYSIPSTSTSHNTTFDSRERENRISDDTSNTISECISLSETGSAMNLNNVNNQLPEVESQSVSNDAQNLERVKHSDTPNACQSQSTEEVKRTDRTPEEIAEARAARLKRLEEQCQQLYNKVTRTTHRSTALCNRLEELHEQYRGSESPPGIRNELSQTTVSGIPVTPPFLSSNQNPRSPVSTSSTSPVDYSSSRCCDTSETKNIPSPPPLPSKLPARRIPTHARLSQSGTATTEISTPPPLPHTLPVRRISTCTEMDQTVIIPSPPPFPQNLRGRRLPTSMTETDSQDSRNHCASENTTRQISNDVQEQEELPQETNTADCSMDITYQTDDNVKH